MTAAPAARAADLTSTPVPLWAADAARHAVVEHPFEACGAVAVASDGGVTTYRLANVAADPADRFAVDPAEQLSTWQLIEDRGQRLAAVYHSHTSTEAVPSRTDEAHAAYAGDVLHLILCTAQAPRGPRVRAWRSQGNRLVEVPVPDVLG